MDPIVQGLLLGGLVHHELGGSHLAAVVQPAGDMDGLPLLLVEPELGERPLLLGTGGFGQHPGQLRHPLAMAAGVGALGVDRAGHQLDEGLQQLFLLLQQALILDGGGRGARQRLNEADA